MRQWRALGLALGLALCCFVLGAMTQATFAQSRRLAFSPALFQGQDKKAAATALLDGALQLAGDGSWKVRELFRG